MIGYKELNLNRALEPKIREMCRKGYNTMEIANKFRISSQLVNKYLEEWGIKR